MNNNKLGKYVESPPITKENFRKILKIGKTRDIIRALIRLSMNSADVDYIQNQCALLLKTNNSDLICATAIALEHVQRLHGCVRPDLIDKLREYSHKAELKDSMETSLELIDHWTRISAKGKNRTVKRGRTSEKT
jgi:hypothetical protein